MIYFITNGKNTKVGQTTDSENTLKRLQEGSDKALTLVNTLEGGIELETKCHFLFNAYRILGDWYELPESHQRISEIELDQLYRETLAAQEKNDGASLFSNLNLVHKHGFAKALVMEHIFMKLPHDDKAKLNVIGLAKVLPISASTAQRSVKELVEEEGYLIKHSRSEYSVATLFFDTFPEYKNKFVL